MNDYNAAPPKLFRVEFGGFIFKVLTELSAGKLSSSFLKTKSELTRYNATDFETFFDEKNTSSFFPFFIDLSCLFGSWF